MEKNIKHSIFKLIHTDDQMIKNVKLLIIGVGGIGCEILKVLSKMPIGTVHIIDMDTIELSNLNRQFLFKKEHKGMSKSLVARDTILQINPHLNIVAHHMNIKELPINFFKQFDFLIMALDNIQARNYVNKVGVRLNIPIIDAGTLGYKGNVATILPKLTKCYSCQPKSSQQQKQFPVCTIRMRPEKPIHCIVWAKLLFEVLFGSQNQENDLKDLAVLAKDNNILEILSKLYESDILDIKNAKEESENKLSELFAKSIKTITKEEINQNLGSTSTIQTFNKHDEKTTVQQNISILTQSFERLNKQKQEQGVVMFQKDDDDIIHFVSSAANLRMHCFSIQTQSFNEVKNMAGNIVPAIASTNSIVSGIEIVEMMKVIKKQTEKMKSYFIQNLNSKVIGLKLEKNLDECQICNQMAIPTIISVNLMKYRLIDLVEMIKGKIPALEEFSINYGPKEFFNSEEPKESLLQKCIFELCSSLEVDLIITNQQTMKKVCVLWLIHEESLESPLFQNQEKLTMKIETEDQSGKQEQKDQNKQNNGDDDNDIVLFDDDASPDIEIVEVRKKPQQQEAKENHNIVATQIVQDLKNTDTLHEKPIELEQNSQQAPIQPQLLQQAQKRSIEVISDGENENCDSIKKKVKQNDE